MCNIIEIQSLYNKQRNFLKEHVNCYISMLLLIFTNKSQLLLLCNVTNTYNGHCNIIIFSDGTNCYCCYIHSSFLYIVNFSRVYYLLYVVKTNCYTFFVCSLCQQNKLFVTFFTRKEKFLAKGTNK